MDKTEEYRKMELKYFRAVWKSLRPSNYWYSVLWDPANPNQNLRNNVF